jgi:hypothetical protein
MGAFDEILKVADEADRTVLNKYPDLKKFVDERDVLATEVNTLRPKFKEADEAAKKWEAWRFQNWDQDAGTTKTEKAMAEMYRAEAARAAALEAASGADMTFEEILTNLQQKGFATKAEIEQVITEKTKTFATKEDTTNVGNNLDKAMQFVYAKSYNLGRRHEKEFGEELDMAAVLTYMGKNQIADPELAYSQMIAPKREELRKKQADELAAKHTKELEDAKKAGIEEGAKKTAMSQRVPTDQQGPGGLGHLQRAQLDRSLVKKDTNGAPEVPTGVKLGDGVLTQLGWEELLKSREAAS